MSFFIGFFSAQSGQGKEERLLTWSIATEATSTESATDAFRKSLHENREGMFEGVVDVHLESIYEFVDLKGTFLVHYVDRQRRPPLDQDSGIMLPVVPWPHDGAGGLEIRSWGWSAEDRSSLADKSPRIGEEISSVFLSFGDA